MPRAVTVINAGGNAYNINDMNTADEFSASDTVSYAKGDYCYRAGYLYRFTEAHTGNWVPGHVVQVKLAEELTGAKNSMDTSVSTLETELSTAVSTLETELNTAVSSLEDAIQGSERSVTNMVRPSNLFDVTASTFGKRLSADGITDNLQFMISDYMDVLMYADGTIYFYDAVPYVEVYNTNKEKLGGRSNVTSINLGTYTGARYIRISLGATAAYTMIVSNRQTGTHQDYGLTFTRPNENLDIRKQIADWDYRNNVTAENILMDAAGFTFFQCCGYKSYKWVTDGQWSIALDSQNGETTELRWTTNSAKNLVGVQIIRLKVFCEHASHISSVTLAVEGTSAFTRTITRTFTYGWNDIPIITAQSTTLSDATWNTSNQFRIYFTGTGNFIAYVGAVNLERMEKAKCIFVDDHSYHGFKERAYPLLKAVGQPVTWALNPGRLGEIVSTGPEQILTQEDIDELALDYYSEFSMHNWNPTNNATANMTPDELREDYQKCITYLKKNGLCPTHLWRAALTQNKATNWWVAKEIVEAAAVHDDTAGYEIWPFANPYNVKRLSIHRRPLTDVHKWFDYARLTHCTLVLYTHGCVVNRADTDLLHCTVAEIEYLCTEIAAGVEGGWLEPTTYNRLRMLQEKGWTTLTNT